MTLVTKDLFELLENSNDECEDMETGDLILMENLEILLRNNNLSYELIHHDKPIHSAQEGKITQDIYRFSM